jgi:hypothetical protein
MAYPMIIMCINQLLVCYSLQVVSGGGGGGGGSSSSTGAIVVACAVNS